ncbi:MAG: hypothetical protein AAF750_14915 [Planctomycetota bacterium]
MKKSMIGFGLFVLLLSLAWGSLAPTFRHGAEAEPSVGPHGYPPTSGGATPSTSHDPNTCPHCLANAEQP